MTDSSSSTYIVPMPSSTDDHTDWGALAAQYEPDANGAPIAFGVPTGLIGVATIPGGSPLAADTPLPVMATEPAPPTPPPPAPPAPTAAQTLATAAAAATTLDELKAAVVAYAAAQS